MLFTPLGTLLALVRPVILGGAPRMGGTPAGPVTGVLALPAQPVLGGSDSATGVAAQPWPPRWRDRDRSATADAAGCPHDISHRRRQEGGDGGKSGSKPSFWQIVRRRSAASRPRRRWRAAGSASTTGGSGGWRTRSRSHEARHKASLARLIPPTGRQPKQKSRGRPARPLGSSSVPHLRQRRPASLTTSARKTHHFA
jgi:hypothetical protein